jgi:ABC-type Mn2+/Zn2+ transport system permease subunit
MRTLEYLTGPDASLFLPGVAAGAAIALVCGVLSVFVVLRRLAFVGHGVSHAAFGGVGLAAVLGLTAAGAVSSAGYFAVVGGFCIVTALAIALVSTRSRAREDTVIGVVLVASMALGAILLQLHARQAGVRGGASLESTLFGSILAVGPADALAAWIVAASIGAFALLFRRPLLFWAFDEPAAEAFGVPTGRARLLLMAMLGVAIVAAMKLAGVLLATALLILPGAIALRLSSRLAPVFILAPAAALLGVLGGLTLSFETDWPPGPSVVVVLVAMMLASALSGVLRR